MQAKTKLLFIVTLMLLTLGIFNTITISLNFRDYGIQSAMEKSQMTASIVQDGLTAHMVNGIMDKRQYFLDQISSKEGIKSLWLVRSENVIKQYGAGFHNEGIRDAIDKEVLQTGKALHEITEKTNKILLRVTIPYNATTTSKPDCLSCHDVKKGDTLGAISMEFDITNMRFSGIYTILKIFGVTIALIAIALFLINYYITPYTELFSNLKEGITKAYTGDFTHKFESSVTDDGKQIVDQMNTLFEKIQSTFGHIKYSLQTFADNTKKEKSNDPLYEAKTIIDELSDIYKFKKTIELDASKDVVYSRIIHILENKYNVKHFAFYELNNISGRRRLIHITQGTSICHKSVDHDSNLCRAHRTKTDVISIEFENLCQSCQSASKHYICLPFSINKDNSLVLSMTANSKEEINILNSKLSSIRNYLEAANPVIESKLLMEKLRDTSLRDGMTGLYNRRFLEEFIAQVMSQASRENKTYSVMMLDVDFFKMVNDTYGHDVGDKVIVEIGKVLHNSIREADLAIRYGGEEFVVMLHNASNEGTLEVAKKIHKAFGDLVFDVGNGETMQKTMSIGIAKFPSDGDTIWKCIKFADTALYVAKTTGRNKIVEYKREMSESATTR